MDVCICSNVIEQDLMGPFEDRPLPLSSAVAPLWSTQLIVCNVYFLSFSDAKKHHQMEEIN